MTKQQKLEAVSKAITTQEKNNKIIAVYNNDIPEEVKLAILDIQHDLGVAFELSYEIMANACGIISDTGIEDVDFWAEADSSANVYTAVQLSYLSINNEAEISEIMKDEAVESIAQACSIWYSRKVVEACEALKEYIIN